MKRNSKKKSDWKIMNTGYHSKSVRQSTVRDSDDKVHVIGDHGLVELPLYGNIGL